MNYINVARYIYICTTIDHAFVELDGAYFEKKMVKLPMSSRY